MTCSTDYWGELDHDVLRLLAQCPDGLSFQAIGHKLGMSEDATRAIVTMLAQEGKLRIHGVATVSP